MSEVRYKSEYTDLVVSGCSFTINEHPSTHVAWPNCLAVWAGLRIHNLAVCGADNEHVSNSIILFLEKSNLDPKTTLVMPMWSGTTRFSLLTGRSVPKDDRDFRYLFNYNEYTELTVGSISTNKRMKDLFTNLHSYKDIYTGALQTWLAMTALMTYLRCNKYDHYYNLTYLDIFRNSDQYLACLEKIGLTLPGDNWLVTQKDEIFGGYAAAKGLVNDDKWHPSPTGHESWVTDVLAPKLLDRGELRITDD